MRLPSIRHAGFPQVVAWLLQALLVVFSATTAVAAPGVLLVANRGTNPGVVSRANLDGTAGHALAIGGVAANPTFIALDLAAGKMYLTNHTSPNVVSAYLDGSGAVDLGDLGTELGTGYGDPYGIALDVNARKMYVVVRGTNRVVRANLDGSGAVHLAIGVPLVDPYGIALDLGAGKMYVVNTSTNAIVKANLDGSSAVSLPLGGLLNVPLGVALDVAAGKMYVLNLGGTVIRANLDGTSPASLGNVGGTGVNSYGLALDTVAGKMYVTNYTPTGGVVKANLDGTGVVPLGNLDGTLNYPVGIAVIPVLPMNCSMDVDGNGAIDALTDSMLVLRASMGLTGTAVTNGAIGAGATRSTWADIRAYLNANCGTNYAP
jgi:low density lipoprotein receptor-related protein 5/6